jgi:hypothetical protein
MLTAVLNDRGCSIFRSVTNAGTMELAPVDGTRLRDIFLKDEGDGIGRGY